MAVQLQTEDPLKAGRRKLVASVIFVSILIHVLVGLGAAIWIVARYLAPPEATFEARKTVALPPKVFDPKMASAELEASAPKPVLDQQLASLRATDFALPDVPRMPVDQVVNVDPSAVVSDQLTGLLDATGGAGAGGGGGGGGNLSAVSFFGIQDQARRVVIVFDVSLSVLNKADKSGVPITRIKEEAMKLIDGLSINTLFNLVQFSRIYQPMAPEMQAPSDAGKAQAKAWLEKEFRTDGSLPRSVKGSRSPPSGQDNGIAFVLDGVLAMKPDVIFLISDGSFQSELNSTQVPWKDIENAVEKHQKLGVSPKIHFIGFEMKPEDKKELKKLVRKTEGQIREVGQD